MALQLSESIWELKETAKWARNPIEKKVAIKTLATRGDEALPSLEEILAVTAYDEIKTICENAIKSVREKKSDEKSSSTTEKSKGSRLADLPP